MPDVSVIIPLFRRHRGHDVLSAVTQAWLDQDLACEVIVAIAGDHAVSVAEDVDADRQVRILRAGAEVSAPGVLRNLAASQARAPILYLSDADIAPLGRDFLARALNMANGQALCQPWMYRLDCEPDGLSIVDCKAPMPGLFSFVTVAPDGSLRRRSDERFTWRRLGHGGVTLDTPIILPTPHEVPEPTENEPHWLAPFHWGGLLLDRRVFEDVGGYCQRYVGWGSEDDDLLFKVAARRQIIRAWWVDISLNCLHFEHPRPYFGTAEREANRALYFERVAAGAAVSIQEDLLAQNRTGLSPAASGSNARPVERT